MRLSRLLIFAALVFTGCAGDNPTTQPLTNAPSTVPGSASFTFTGGGDGTFSATGSAADAASGGLTKPYAFGYSVGSSNSTSIFANQVPAGSLANELTLTFKGQAAGTGTFDVGCTSSSTVACNALRLDIGVQDAAHRNFQCYLTSGSVTVSSISSNSTTGSFSGSGSCVSSATGATSAFTVTAGSFSVPLSSAS